MSRRRNPIRSTDKDNPEWTPADFARARPAAEVLREQFGNEVASHLLRPKRGRPPKASPKRALNIRVSQSVLEYFRSTGTGWQTRMNEVLSRYVARRASRSGKSSRRARV